jgi:hypothetical protein
LIDKSGIPGPPRREEARFEPSLTYATKIGKPDGATAAISGSPSRMSCYGPEADTARRLYDGLRFADELTE